jgi:hypothetical protein
MAMVTTTTPPPKQPDPTPDSGTKGVVLQWLKDHWWIILLLAGGCVLVYFILHVLGIV